MSLANLVADTSSTTAADPGAGNVRWNHATQASATELYIDDVDADANNMAALWTTLNAGGFVYLYQRDDLDVWQQWLITSITDEAGYAKLAVSLQGSNGSFAGDAEVVATIQQPNPPAGVDRNVVTPVSSSAGVTTLNASIGDYFKTALTENTTIALASVPTACTLHLQITQHASTPRSVAWPGTFDWGAGNSAPVMPTGASKVLDVMMTTNDAGASFIATARERS